MVNCKAHMFWFWFFFFQNSAIGYLVGRSRKTLWNFPRVPSKNHIFYILLQLHYFTRCIKPYKYIFYYFKWSCKTICVFIFTFTLITQHKIDLHDFTLTLTWNVSPKPFVCTTLVHIIVLSMLKHKLIIIAQSSKNNYMPCQEFKWSSKTQQLHCFNKMPYF